MAEERASHRFDMSALVISRCESLAHERRHLPRLHLSALISKMQEILTQVIVT